MTAPAPSPAEQAVIDRFGIFDEERIVEEVARALFESAEREDWPEDQRRAWADEFPNAQSFWRRLAVAAVAAYRATQDGGECQQSDWCGPGSHCLCPPAAGGADGGLRDALLKHHPIAHTNAIHPPHRHVEPLALAPPDPTQPIHHYGTPRTKDPTQSHRRSLPIRRQRTGGSDERDRGRDDGGGGVSWGVNIIIDHADGYTTDIEVVSGHTYNLTPMWRKAGVFESSRDLDGRSAGMLAPILSAALIDAVRNRAAYEELNPANGWGDYDGFVEILTRFAQLAWEHPKGTLRWNG